MRPAAVRPRGETPPPAAAMPAEVVEVENARKVFGARAAVDGVSLVVRESECYGLLGPNGAGKTSLLRMLYGVSPITAGSVRVLSRDVSDPREARIVRGLVGVVPQQDNLDSDLTVRDNLVVYGHYFGIGRKWAGLRADELLAWVHLSDRARDDVSDLSGGLRRRLILARALMNRPRLLILDEPTTGLDPAARFLLWDKLRELTRSFVTVVLSTHDMDEAEAVCDRLACLDRGRVLVEGAPRALVERHLGPRCVFLRPRGDLAAGALSRLTRLSARHERRGRDHLFFARDTKPVLRAAAATRPAELRERPTSLEDLFIALTGRELSE